MLPGMAGAGGGTPFFRGFVMRHPADSRLFELSAAAGEAFFNGLFKASVVVTNNKAGDLSRNVSRITS